MRKITIVRPKKFVGKVMTCRVLVDNREAAAVKDNETVTFEIPDGVCKIKVVGSPLDRQDYYESDIVSISESEGDCSFTLIIKMGVRLKLYLERMK